MCVKYVFKVSIPEVPSSKLPASAVPPSAPVVEVAVSASAVLLAAVATNALPQIVTPGVGVVSAPSSARPVKSNSAKAVLPVIVNVSTSSPVE